jgi:hypothetical protein
MFDVFETPGLRLLLLDEREHQHATPAEHAFGYREG